MRIRVQPPISPLLLIIWWSLAAGLFGQNDAAVVQQMLAGDLKMASGKFAQARFIYRSAALQRGQIATATKSQLHEAYYRLLNAEYLVGDYDSAAALAQSMLDKVSLQPEEQSQVIYHQGLIAMERGDLAAAAGYFGRAANYSGPAVGLVRAAEGELLRRRELFAEALRKFEEAAALLRGQNGTQPKEILFGPISIDIAHGKYDDARKGLTALSASWNLPEEHPDTVYLKLLSGYVAIQQGDLSRSAQDLKSTIPFLENAAGRLHPLYAEALALNLQQALLAGVSDQAKISADAAVQYLANEPNVAIMGRSQLQLALASYQMFLGDPPAAQKYALQALSTRSAVVGEDSLSAAAANVATALAEVQLNRTNLAEQRYLSRAQAALASKMVTPAQETRRAAELVAGLVLHQRGDVSGANERFKVWLSSSRLRGEWGSTIVREIVSDSLLSENKMAEASKMLKETLDLYTKPVAKPNNAAISRVSVKLARARLRLGDSPGVVSALEAVLGREEIRTTLLPLDQAEAYRMLGESYTLLQVPTEAVNAYQSSLRLMEGRVKQDEPQFLVVLESTAGALVNAKRRTDATSIFRRLLTIRDQKFDPMSTESITVVSRLADLYFEAGAFEQAGPLYERLIDATAKGKTVADRKLLLERVGETYGRTGKRAQAAAAYDQRARLALDRHIYAEAEDFAARIQKVAGESADTAVYRAGALNILGDIRTAQNKLDDAERLYKEAAALATGNAMVEAASLNSIGRLALKQKDSTRARENLDRALNLINGVTTSPGKRGLEAMLTANTAAVKAFSGDTNGAVELYDRFLNLESGTTVDDPPLIEYLDEVANLFARVPAKSGEVGEIYRRRLTASTRAFGDTSQEAAYAHYNLAESLSLKRDFPLALQEFREAQRIFDVINGPESDESVTALTGLASTQARAGQLDAALKSYETLLATAQNSKDNPARKQSGLLNAIALLHRQSGRHVEAREVFQKITTLWKAESATEPLWTAAMRNIGISYADEGASKEVEPHFTTLRQAVRRAAANKDSLVEVQVLKDQALAMKKIGRAKEADHAQRQADSMEKRVGSRK